MTLQSQLCSLSDKMTCSLNTPLAGKVVNGELDGATEFLVSSKVSWDAN